MLCREENVGLMEEGGAEAPAENKVNK